MPLGITGPTGFIGSHLRQFLLSRQRDSVRLLTRRANATPVESREEVISGDLSSDADCARFVNGLDTIYYLAHCSSPATSDRDLVADAQNNLIPLLKFIHAVQEAGTVPHIVYFSSGGAVYSPSVTRTPYREDDPCFPLSSYGIQKLSCEHYLRSAAAKGKLTVTVLRIGNAYGTLLPNYRMQGLIGVAMANVLEQRPVRVFGSFENVRDYVHLNDVCEAALLASKARAPYTVFNIGTGTGHSVREALRLIERSWGHPIDVRLEDSCSGLLPDWAVLDCTKARMELGWTPAVELSAGIQHMLTQWHEPLRIRTAVAR